MPGEVKKRLVEESWRSYRLRVIPPDASRTQLLECRRAFYAGAHGLLRGILGILEPGAEATDADLRTMDSIQMELDEFYAQLKAGTA
jgi:hypothetical protein